MEIMANTISTNDKEIFETILGGMAEENINSQDDLIDFLKGFNRSFRRKHLGRDLDELIVNAVHHLRKQNSPHKWSSGGPEDQTKNFNKENFEKLLKFYPGLDKIWEGELRANSGHTPGSRVFLPENSAFASFINDSWAEVVQAALDVVDGTETDKELNELAEIAISLLQR